MRYKLLHTIVFKHLLFVAVVLQTTCVIGQDIHFSNWQMSPLNLNPANTGMFEGDGRIIFNYRNQQNFSASGGSSDVESLALLYISLLFRYFLPLLFSFNK